MVPRAWRVGEVDRREAVASPFVPTASNRWGRYGDMWGKTVAESSSVAVCAWAEAWRCRGFRWFRERCGSYGVKRSQRMALRQVTAFSDRVVGVAFPGTTRSGPRVITQRDLRRVASRYLARRWGGATPGLRFPRSSESPISRLIARSQPYLPSCVGVLGAS